MLGSPAFASPYLKGSQLLLASLPLELLCNQCILLLIAFVKCSRNILAQQPMWPQKFDTPEKLKKHVQESFRTICQLHDLYEAGGDSETRYRCIATIKGLDSQQHWC